MESVDLRTLLNQGIQAVKGNDRARARELLLQVLDADDRNEPAWLWLAAALDEPADQLMALERVLAINPRHPQALAGAQALRLRLGQVVAQPAPDQGLAAEPANQRSSLQAEPIPGATDLAQTASGPEPAIAAEPAVATYDTLSAEDDPFQCAYCGRQ